MNYNSALEFLKEAYADLDFDKEVEKAELRGELRGINIGWNLRSIENPVIRRDDAKEKVEELENKLQALEQENK